MKQAYFITGTDTDIGKTYTAVKLIARWRAEGKRVLAMKPVAAGCEVLANGRWYNSDVERLCQATGQLADTFMNPYRFLPPVSPHIAARAAGVTIAVAYIVRQYQRLAQDADVVLVEGAGGWMAPLSEQMDMAGLARALQLPVILVVGMRLGCLNHALLTARAICADGLPLAGWVANCVGPQQAAYAENLATLTARIEAPLLLELPYVPLEN